MARLPRYVIPGQPQHIIQRGNNRQTIFAAEADYQFFRDALVEASLKLGLAIRTKGVSFEFPFEVNWPGFSGRFNQALCWSRST